MKEEYNTATQPTVFSPCITSSFICRHPKTLFYMGLGNFFKIFSVFSSLFTKHCTNNSSLTLKSSLSNTELSLQSACFMSSIKVLIDISFLNLLANIVA